jgi:hypothetical protein
MRNGSILNPARSYNFGDPMTSQSDPSAQNANNNIQAISAHTIEANRIRVNVELFEAHSRPNLILTLNDSNLQEVARSIIMGTIDKHVEFTLHVRVKDPTLPLTFTCVSFIQEEEPIDTKSILVQDSK